MYNHNTCTSCPHRVIGPSLVNWPFLIDEKLANIIKEEPPQIPQHIIDITNLRAENLKLKNKVMANIIRCGRYNETITQLKEKMDTLLKVIDVIYRKALRFHPPAIKRMHDISVLCEETYAKIKETK